MTPEALREALVALERQRRIVRLTIGGEERYVAVEDVARFRDAVGIPPPAGLPQSLLEPVRDPVGDLVGRFARTHGPFRAEDLAARYGMGLRPIVDALMRLEESGRLVQGEFRPGGSGREWCDAGVLRTLRARSLARLRNEIEPAEAVVLSRLSLAWHRVTDPGRGAGALLDAVEQLQGAPVPASDLEAGILRSRVADYEPRTLDELLASGSLLWVGCRPIGERDGQVKLLVAGHAGLLHSPASEPPSARIPRAIAEHLRSRGASFFPALMTVTGATVRETSAAIWDLVWSGHVTNDTLQPLRAFLRGSAGPRKMGHRALSRPLASVPPETMGRWALVEDHLASHSPTEKAAACARQLLARHGVLTREAVRAEEVPGGFGSLYPVLKQLEESGQIRRGYFISGLGASQFALPGAVDLLRRLTKSDPGCEGGPDGAILLQADDPANVYGASLPWPSPPATDGEDGAPRRPARSAGAVVVLVAGALAAWQGRRERDLTFWGNAAEGIPLERTAELVANALADQVRLRGRRSVYVREVNGRPARESVLGGALAAAGFRFGPDGYMLRM